MSDINLSDMSEPINNLIKSLFGSFTKEASKALEYRMYKFFYNDNIKIEKLNIDGKYKSRYLTTDYNYKKDFLQEVSNLKDEIPYDCLYEPDLNIFNEIMNEAERKIEIEQVRHMLAKLLADSMNSKRVDNIHPSYINLLSQMSPMDVSNIKLIKENKKMPIACYNIKKSGKIITFLKHVFISNPEANDIESQIISMELLKKLGLIEIYYDQYFSDKKLYRGFYDEVIYKNLKDVSSIDDTVLLKGIVQITVYGNKFVDMLS